MNVIKEVAEHLVMDLRSSALNKSFLSCASSVFFVSLGMSGTSSPMSAFVDTWQAQWKAAGRTVWKNKVNNLSEHLCPCRSFISASLPPFPSSWPVSFCLHPQTSQEEVSFWTNAITLLFKPPPLSDSLLLAQRYILKSDFLSRDIHAFSHLVDHLWTSYVSHTKATYNSCCL